MYYSRFMNVLTELKNPPFIRIKEKCFYLFKEMHANFMFILFIAKYINFSIKYLEKF